MTTLVAIVVGLIAVAGAVWRLRRRRDPVHTDPQAAEVAARDARERRNDAEIEARRLHDRRWPL